MKGSRVSQHLSRTSVENLGTKYMQGEVQSGRK